MNSVSALTSNYACNVDTLRGDLERMATEAPTADERALAAQGLDALDNNRVKRVVTNANFTTDERVLADVSDQLHKQGIEFIDVMRPDVDYGIGSPS